MRYNRQFSNALAVSKRAGGRVDYFTIDRIALRRRKLRHVALPANDLVELGALRAISSSVSVYSRTRMHKR